jgi:hypothetical protein
MKNVIIRGLTIDHPTKSKPNSNFTKPKLVQQGDKAIQFVTLNSTQSNDISINLITCVNFLEKICPKSCVVFQALPLSIFQP